MSETQCSKREEMREIFRRVNVVAFLIAALIVFSPGKALAISIPVPNINGVSPASVAPGGADFTLTVNGSNFVGSSFSTVYWNSTALVTTYVGRNRLTAVVPAALIGNPGPGWITVVNIGASGASNLAFVSVTSSTGVVAFVQSDITIGGSNQAVALGDFNGDGKLDIVAGPYTGTTISVLLGNGDGTFQPAITSTSGGQSGITVGDFNNDGVLDVAIVRELSSTVSILLGNGDGTFQAAHTYATPVYAYQVAVGDFNGDGKLDVAVANEGNSSLISVFLGNGDGTLQTPATNTTVGLDPYGIVVGDFNGDGKLDLAVTNFSGGTLTILLGDGTGSFVAQSAITIGSNPLGLAVGDFNNDGNADLAVSSETTGTVSVLLGIGDGTFQAPTHYATFSEAFSVAVGDLNGDGILDLAVSGSNAKVASILLGNGDGTFQAQQTFGTGSFGWTAAMGDFDGSGRLGLAIADYSAGKVRVLLQGVVVTPSPVTFASQGVGSTSAAQTLTLTNATGSAVTVSAITFSGTNPADFAETDNCVSIAVASAATCTIQVTFTPSITGAETATLSVADNSHGSPQTVILNGTGAAAPAAILAPTGLIFTTQTLGLPSAIQTVTLTNTGNATLSGIAISITGTNGADFGQTNDCSATLAASALCTISVTFTPSLVGSESASLSIADNAPGNPQIASLSGTGAQITPTITWATPDAITYGAALSGTQLNASTGVAGTFVYLPASGAVLTAGSQTLSVTFTPTDTTTYTSATANVTLMVNKATPVLTWATPAAITYGTALSGTQLNATSSVAGSFVYTPLSGAVLATGSQTLSATFTPTDAANYVGAASSVTLAVGLAPTTNALSMSGSSTNEGASVTFTASLSSSAGVPAGSVSFLDGVTSLGTGILSSGSATFTTSTLALGAHAITAVYPATGNFQGSSSSASTETITAANFSLGPGSGAGATLVTISAGQTAQFPMTLAALGSFSGQVTFSVSGLPPNSTATFAPGTVTVGASPVPDTLSVITTSQFSHIFGQTPARPRNPLSTTTILLTLFMFVGFVLLHCNRGRCRPRFALLALLIVAGVLGGCAGSQNVPTSTTLAGTYPLVVTATSGATQHTTNMTLIVQ